MRDVFINTIQQTAKRLKMVFTPRLTASGDAIIPQQPYTFYYGTDGFIEGTDPQSKIVSLPTSPLGSVVFDYEIDRIVEGQVDVSRGSFSLAEGEQVNLSGLIVAGVAASPSVLDYIETRLGEMPILPEGGLTTQYLQGDGANGAAWATLNQAAVGITDSDDITEGAANLYFTTDERAKLTGIEAGATADQTGAEIKALYEAELDTNAFTDAEKVKVGNLSGTNTGDNAVNTLYSGLEASKQDVITGLTASGAELNILDGALISTTELNYLDGVTSAVQGQLNDKADLSSATFTGAVLLPDGSIAAPSVSGANYADTGLFWSDTTLQAATRLGVSVDGASAVSFHSTTQGTDVAGVAEATGFLRVKGTLLDSGGSKAGVAFAINSLAANQLTNGTQNAVLVHLKDGGGIGTRATYGLNITNESKSSKETVGISAYCDGGVGTTPGLTIGGLFGAKDSDTGAVGSWGYATENTNPTPRHIGVIGYALNGDTANVGGYFGLQAMATDATLPTVSSSAALMCDNGAESADIFVARDNGTPVFTIADGGDATFSGTVAGITQAMVGLANVDNTSDATKNAAVAILTNKTISGDSNTLSNIAQSSITDLTTDLAAKANLTGADFTGSVGVGNGNLGARLGVTAAAVASNNETVAKFMVADDAASFVSVFNNTSTNSIFDPTILGYSGSARIGLQFIGGALTDTGTSPLIAFQARIGSTSGAAVTIRPLVDFSNFGTSALRILVNGNTGFSTTTPRRKVDALDATNPQLRLTHTDNSVYTDIQTNSSGNTLFTNTGTSYSFDKTIAATNLSGTNTGDQTTIVGITGTKAQFSTAVTDGDILYSDAVGVTVQGYSAVLAATTASFLTADETKLDGIEALADVTDEANVLAALDGATIAGATIDSANNTLTIAQSAVTNLVTDLAGKQDFTLAADNVLPSTATKGERIQLLNGKVYEATATDTWSEVILAPSTGSSANQIVGRNSGNTANEFKTLTAGDNVTITHGANSITIAASGAALQTENAYLALPVEDILTTSTVASAPAAANTVYFFRFVPRFSIRVASVKFRTEDAGNFFAAGVYSADGNTKLIDTGAVAGEAATYKNIDVTDTTLQAGTPYILAWTVSDTALRLRSHSTTNGTQAISIMNTGVSANNAMIGSAANVSASGVLPATLGNLTGASLSATPIVILHGG